MISVQREEEHIISADHMQSALTTGLDGILRTLGVIRPNEYFEVELPWKVRQMPVRIKIRREQEVSRTESGKGT